MCIFVLRLTGFGMEMSELVILSEVNLLKSSS
jgi:hypothetical protein